MEEVEDVEGCWCWQQRDGAAIFFFYLVSYVGIFCYVHTISHLSPKHLTRTNLLTPTREMMVANTTYTHSRR